VFAVLGAAILVVIASTVWGSALLLLVLGGYTWAAYWTFGHEHLWLPFVAPAFSLVVSFVATGTVRFATTGRELRQTRGTLNRYMAPQLVEYVLNNVDNLNFAGEKRELTIFFSDVRNFTTLTEKSDPMVLISMLNEYLEAMTSTIFKHDGIVDKFIGDGILAYWGAFTPGNHAYQAAEASLEMFGRLKELNTMWKEKGWPEIDIGVGLNTGEVILGNVGAGKKIEFTVIGDPVNLASRLESLNKEYKCHIIISEFTLARLGDAATVRSLGGVKVKGKTIETAIYELQGLRAASAAAAKN
jgi:adenylate cyclase